MTTGESLYEEEVDDLDEDYLDPSFLHTAAELYNNPDLYYEMQSQLESAHGGHTHHSHAPHGPGGLGRGMSAGYPFGDESDYYYDGGMAMGGGVDDRARTFIGANSSSGPRQHQQQQQQPWSFSADEFANHHDDDEIDENTLSPRQYALLMQSMQEPLAMYASTLDSSYQDDNDIEGYSDGLNFSGSMHQQQRRAYPMSPNGQGLSFSMGSAVGGGGIQNLLQASHGAPTTTTTNSGRGESLMVDPAMMLYSPGGGGGHFNPSPTYTYPPPSNLRPADEHGAMIQMRSPVPPPPPQANLSSSEGGGGPGGGYGIDESSLEVHPASMMSATYPGTAGGGGGHGLPMHNVVMPVPPPQSSRNRQYSRPATRQGF